MGVGHIFGWVAACSTGLALLACTSVAREGVAAEVACEITSASQVVASSGLQGPRIVGADGRPLAGSAAPAANETVRAGDLTLSNGHMMTFLGGPTARGGFYVRNDGDLDDRLTAVRSPLADTVGIFSLDPEHGEVEVTSLLIPAGSAFTPAQMAIDLNRGQIRLQFSGLRPPEDPAEGVPVFLSFERAGCVSARVFPMVPRN